MARIEQLYSGNDDINRVAKLKTAVGQIIRPVVKLRKLPIEPWYGFLKQIVPWNTLIIAFIGICRSTDKKLTEVFRIPFWDYP